MVPSGPPTPIGGAQPVPASLLRSNSGLLGGQGGSVPSQTAFPSLVSPRTQFNNVNILGNVANVSSLLHQSFGNGGPNSGLSASGSTQRGVIDTGAESDPLSGVGNGMGFSTPSSSFGPSNMANPGSLGQVQGQQFPNPSGNQMLPDQQQPQQLEPQNFQHNRQPLQQFSAPHNNHQQQQQQQYQSIRGGLGGVAPVKLEPQVTNDQHVQPPQQLQSLRNLASVKLEPQQIQNMRSLAPVKMEPQHSDQPLFLHQQQQQQKQQQFLQMSRQSPQAAAAQINLLHQQRILQQQQQQQQQQLIKAFSQQRSPLQPQFQPQNMPLRSPVKPVYEPGMCARRLTHYMYQQQHRPEDNNIDFWRKFVSEYFAPNAKKKWCVSMYGSGRQTTGVFPQDVWHCEICNRKPGRGFEATVEVLPRLFKIKYESGTLEELLYVDMPREYHNSSGQIVLDYAKAIQESVFEQLRVVRDGQLRIVFSQDLKICSWEFCARRHEELIPRRLLIPQVTQLGAAAQKYQAATQNASSNLSVPELQNNCNMFVASARQLAKALEVPLVNDLGYTKRYVRCLQISEVVNSMKDLIDYSRETGTGPMESLAKFPRRTSTTSGFHGQPQQSEEQLQQQQQQQTVAQNLNNESSVQATAMQLTSTNGVPSVNNSLNSASTTSSTSTIAGLLHQNSMNSKQQNAMNNSNSPYGGSSVQMPSPGSSSTVPQAQPNASPFQTPTPSSSNNLLQTSHSGLAAGAHLSSANSLNISMQQPALSGDGDPNDPQGSVQKIIQEIMSNQFNGGGGMVGVGSLGNDVKNVNGILPTNNSTGLGGNCLVGNGTANSNSGIGGAGFGSMGNGLGQSAMINGIRAAMGNNSMSMNGRVGMTSMARDQSLNHQQQDLGNHLLSGLGAVNGFNNLQFDWKSSP
uniref:Putative SEUSS transcriptional co-regulator isoform 1 n=1 Tax=Davidia involucrata TaxID=16924 RepID=A0A5B7B176_DAVIN